MAELRILGAGIAGLCMATELAARGIDFALVDKEPSPGPHACSWWAGGMLAPWCEGESAEEPVVRLGAQSIGWWQQHTGLVETQGSLVVALGRDLKELDRFARRTENFERLDAAQIDALEPDLAGRFRAALYFPQEAHLSPRAALETLSGNLAAKGIAVQPQAEAATTIDCRGLSARDALTDLRGVKGEMLILRCPDVQLSRPVRLLHPRIPLYIVPRGDGVYMLGATMIEAGERGRITARSLLEMLSAAYALHPAFGEAEVLEIGVDARPAFPDNLPRIRRRSDTIYANGLYRHGFLLAPALARMVADMLETGARPEVMDEDYA
ncbi:glycine oxidase ThiO [Pseudoruegeria sp. SHC-113]|uniref:glycine oxidase ThiO n=1 Tax=Pseudoruegeria sp. SHC-113 TaxID=2855439 RepID=UPI0021BB9F2F|nr:glycine oxidase ThiO [Pseudoruegeria sp. SHC-113]MCT8161958.1 glycine oxidase ThiO [Pseudoruegeria sp. SHC-113]